MCHIKKELMNHVIHAFFLFLLEDKYKFLLFDFFGIKYFQIEEIL